MCNKSMDIILYKIYITHLYIHILYYILLLCYMCVNGCHGGVKDSVAGQFNNLEYLRRIHTRTDTRRT